jgi:hypothetical protein
MTRLAKIITVLALLVLCSSTLAMDGSGTQTDPYIITNVDELQAMRDDLSAHYQLGNDIDASGTVSWNGGAGFEPVGTDTNSFYGTFDGQDYTVTGLYINRPSASGVGLFGRTSGTEIKNVGLVDAEVYGYYTVATLVGSNQGRSTVTSCYATGEVIISASGSNDTKSGGLVGGNGASLISQCYSAVNVTALSSRYQIGGLCGYSRARSGDPPALIENCYSTGTVTSNGWKVGGLLGDADGENSTVSKCYSVGQVSGSHKKGLVGYNFRSPTIKDSYWDTETSTCSSSYGGAGRSTAQMMQQATFVNWDFDEVWGIFEDETYPFLLWELSGVELAIVRLEGAIGKKAAALEALDEALEQEDEAYAVLEEVLASGDYEGLSKRDIAASQRKIESAIRRQERSKRVVQGSIEELEDALLFIGWEPTEPNEPEPDPNVPEPNIPVPGKLLRRSRVQR